MLKNALKYLKMLKILKSTYRKAAGGLLVEGGGRLVGARGLDDAPRGLNGRAGSREPGSPVVF